MYPFGDLPGNLAAFSGVLRRTYGFRIGPGEINDAARVLRHVNLADQRHVRDAWRSILSSSRDTAAAFDRAFDEFFFPGPVGAPQDLPSTAGPDYSQIEARRERPGPDRDASDSEERLDDEAGTGGPSDDSEPDSAEGDEATPRWERSRYSANAVEGVEMLELRPVSAAWRDAARAFIRRLQIGLSRRWRPAARGRRFDLRRTLRASLQTGGEAVTARWLRRVHRSPRLVILIDGSRSMSASHRPALELAVALASVTRRVEVFAFSTALIALTAQVRRAGSGRGARVALSRDTWGGGTSIGASLRTFLQQHGDRRLTRDTLVCIVSDGLEVADPGGLADTMREIRRRAAAVTWLNPLLDTPGYEPTSRGMAAALPHITTFASVTDAAGLARLARVVRIRR